MYATLPAGKVIGEFTIGTIMEDAPCLLWGLTAPWGSVDRGYFQEYFKGKSIGRAIQVINPHRYARPIDLTEIINNKIPPQSFRYLKEE